MVLYLLCLLLISFVLTLIVKVWAVKKAILDLPNERSSHMIPTPRGGGIAIAVTWFFSIIVLLFLHKVRQSLFLALLCGLPISIVGLVDDVINISPKVRLFVQIISAVMALFFLGGLNVVDIGGIHLSLPFLFSVFAVIGIVWFTNLFNFLDGIDGYISTEVIFVGFAFFLLFGKVLPAQLAVITLGFLLLNWQPAKIFMGDVGSTLLGFSIGVFAVYYQRNEDSSIIIWLMLTSLFWFDASLTLYRRWRNGETLSKAHKKHAYQRIVQSGFSHQKTVIFSLVINIFIMGLVWLVKIYPSYSLLFLFVNIAYLYIVVRMVDKRFPFPK